MKGVQGAGVGHGRCSVLDRNGKKTDCGGRPALAAASPALVPPGAMRYLPHTRLLSNPPGHGDGSWAAVRGGAHLHTVTRSEGHEGGGGIGVASISLAHPCMAPGLLPAWGGGAAWGQMGRWGGEKERSDRDIRHGGGDQTKHPQEGQAQGKTATKGRDKAKKDESRRHTGDGTRGSDGMGMHRPNCHFLPAPARGLLPPYVLSVLLPLQKPHTQEPPLPYSRSRSFSSLQPPRPVFLAHTPPHFLGARAPPPLQTCSAHPAVAGRTRHS